MRKLLLGLAGSAMIGLGALAMSPAQAAPLASAAIDVSHVATDAQSAPGFSAMDGVQTVQYMPPPGYRPGYRPPPPPPPPGYRPPPPRGGYYGRGSRCWMETTRFWNGYRYVKRSREVCR